MWYFYQVYSSVYIIVLDFECIFKNLCVAVSHSSPACSYVLDQTFHLFATFLLCPAPGTIHPRAYIHIYYIHPPHPHPTMRFMHPRCLKTTWFKYTYTSMPVTLSFWYRVTTADWAAASQKAWIQGEVWHKKRCTYKCMPTYQHTHSHTSYPVQQCPNSDSDATSLSLGSGD